MPDGPRSRHSEFSAVYPTWQLMRDCLAGEAKIKTGSEKYLPRPSGQVIISGDDPTANHLRHQAYTAYLTRACFPDLLAPTVRGINGVLHRKPARIELPTALEYLKDRATPDLLSLGALSRRVAADLLALGRHILLVDAPRAPSSTARPYLVSYRPECLINWREEVIEDRRLLTLAVLETEAERPDPDDPFRTKCVKQWRVLRLDNGRYVQDLYEEDDRREPSLIESGIMPVVRGEPFREIPMVCVGAVDLTPEVGEIPLLGLARLSLGIFRKSADYEQALYMTSQPTPYVTGVMADSEDRPRTLGSTTIWYLQDPQARAGFLEFSGQGVAAQRQAIADDYGRAADLGAVMLEEAKRAAETAEALRLRQAARSATLEGIAQNLGEAFRRCLRWAAQWSGAETDSIEYSENRDFLPAEISAQDLQVLVTAWQSGLIPKQVAWHNAREGERIPAEWDDETLKAMLDAEGPALGMIGAGEESV